MIARGWAAGRGCIEHVNIDRCRIIEVRAGAIIVEHGDRNERLIVPRHWWPL